MSIVQAHSEFTVVGYSSAATEKALCAYRNVRCNVPQKRSRCNAGRHYPLTVSYTYARGSYALRVNGYACLIVDYTQATERPRYVA